MNYLTVQPIFDTELVRLAIFLSALVGLLVYERYGISTGGTVVAGYLALWLPQPTHVLMTMLIALFTYLIVHKLLRPRLMLWGRQLFETEIVVALALQSLWFVALLLLAAVNPAFGYLYGIGFLLPGVMAHDMGRQGVWRTLAVIMGSAGFIFGMIFLLGELRHLTGLTGFLGGITHAQGASPLTYPIEWLVIGVNVSVIMNILLYHHWNVKGVLADDSIRTGGFVSAAYLALMLSRPADLIVIILCSALTYLIVSRFLMRQTLLFGRAKVNMMFMTGFVVTALVEWGIAHALPNLIVFSGFNAIVPTLVALLANDAERQGVRRTAVGASAATLGVFGALALLLFVTGM